MSVQVIAFLISSTALCAVLWLFSHEQKRGRRYLGMFRSYVDFHLLKIRHAWNVGVRKWGRYFFRQIIHYFFHTLLVGTIQGLAALEERLKSVARTNRLLARKSEKERTTLNKLDEIALHKMKTVLSEEEKRVRRKESLDR